MINEYYEVAQIKKASQKGKPFIGGCQKRLPHFA